MADYTKKQVYQIAKDSGLAFLVQQKPSQDFCYCPNKLIPAFLKAKIGCKPGDIIDVKGKIIGKHHGLHFYTIGQRKRIKLSGGPYYVQDFDNKKNRLIVSKNKLQKLKKEIILSPYNFINGKSLTKKIRVNARLRYRQKLEPATLSPFGKNQLKLVFEQPVKAVTPGQFAVFYQGQVCLGVGKITSY